MDIYELERHVFETPHKVIAKEYVLKLIIGYRSALNELEDKLVVLSNATAYGANTGVTDDANMTSSQSGYNQRI